MGGRLEQPPSSPGQEPHERSQSADFVNLQSENDRLKEYLAAYEQQIKDMETDLNNLR